MLSSEAGIFGKPGFLLSYCKSEEALRIQVFLKMRGIKFFFTSLLFGTFSSGIAFSLTGWFARLYRYPSLQILPVFLVGMAIGFFKSLIIWAIASLEEPDSRLGLILATTGILTLIEAYFYYELWSWEFPFG